MTDRELPRFDDRGAGYKSSLTNPDENPLHKFIAQSTPQAAIVIEYLSSGRGLSALIAHTVLGVTSVSARVAELRKMGMPITGTLHHDHSSKRFMVYRYEPGKEPVDEDDDPGDDPLSRWEGEGGPSHPKHGEPHARLGPDVD